MKPNTLLGDLRRYGGGSPLGFAMFLMFMRVYIAEMCLACPIAFLGSALPNLRAKLAVMEGFQPETFLLTQGNSQCPQYPLTPRACRYIPILRQRI